MRAILDRQLSHENNVVGVLKILDESQMVVFQCTTLENEDKIFSNGVYDLKMNYSEKFKRVLPIVTGVFGRSGIRLHSGNKSGDSAGCILVGGYFLYPMLRFSRPILDGLKLVLGTSLTSIKLEVR